MFSHGAPFPTPSISSARRARRRPRSSERAGVERGASWISDATVTAFAVISICDQVVNWARPDGSFSAQEIADQVVELAIRMVSIDSSEQPTLFALSDFP
ncbi:hypothetical protein HBB16_00055 [Pseudonocardia sp. MCCB 268]|nr:hypothetical protein [Pseudonocardia cytotoxica]